MSVPGSVELREAPFPENLDAEAIPEYEWAGAGVFLWGSRPFYQAWTKRNEPTLRAPICFLSLFFSYHSRCMAALDSTGFNKFLSRLGDDPDSAAERYEEFRLKLTSFFTWKGVATYLADDLADEALDRIAGKVSA